MALNNFKEDDDKKKKVMAIDWCPICGKKLADNKKETRIEHDKQEHPLYTKAQFVGDVKRNKKKLIKGFSVFFGIIAVIMLIVHQASIYSDSISIDCSNVKSGLNNYTKIHGVDKHVLETMNSTKECGFVLSLNYTNARTSDVKALSECKSCQFQIYSYYSEPLTVWNMTKVNKTLSELPKFCNKNYIVC